MFQGHAAGPFDQDHIPRRQQGDDFLGCAARVIEVQPHEFPSFGGRQGSRLRLDAHGDQQVDLRLGDRFAQPGVKRPALLAQFQHVALDQDAAALGPLNREHLQRRQAAGRVRVVGVVDERQAAGQFLADQSHLRRPVAGQGGDNGLLGQPHVASDGHGGQGIEHVVPPGDRQSDLGPGIQLEDHTPGIGFDPVGQDIAVGHAECADRGLGHVGHGRHVRVVAVEHHQAGPADGPHEFFLFLGHAFNAAQGRQVRRTDAGHHTNVGPGDLAQPPQLARGAGAQFQDQVVVVRLAAEDRQRHADKVVERGLRPPALEPGLQNLAQHFLGACLAAGTGDGDDHTVQRATVRRRQIAEGLCGVGHDDDRPAVVGQSRGRGAVAYHHGRSAGIGGLPQKLVAVEPLADQGEEDLARGDGAAVGRNAAQGRPGGAGGEAACGCGDDVTDRDLHAGVPCPWPKPQARSAWRACSRSSKWRRSLPMI